MKTESRKTHFHNLQTRLLELFESQQCSLKEITLELEIGFTTLEDSLVKKLFKIGFRNPSDNWFLTWDGLSIEFQ